MHLKLWECPFLLPRSSRTPSFWLHLLPASAHRFTTPFTSGRCFRRGGHWGTLETGRFLSLGRKQTAAPICYTAWSRKQGVKKEVWTAKGRDNCPRGRSSELREWLMLLCHSNQHWPLPRRRPGGVRARARTHGEGSMKPALRGMWCPAHNSLGRAATDASARSHGNAAGRLHPREPTTMGSLLVTDGWVSISLTERV